LIYSQISSDQGKHDAMVCDRCLKELNAAFEFAERSRSAEKLYFAKRREEFVADKQETEQTLKMKVTGVEGQREDEKIKRESSIEIETVEIKMFEMLDSVMSDGIETNCREENANSGGQEKSPKLFASQASAKSSSLRKEVPVLSNSMKTQQKSSRAQQKSFQCSICSKILSTKQILKRHVEIVHEKKTRFTCTHCLKAFYFKLDLERHIANCHTFTNDDTTNSNRPFKCDIDNCGMFFKTKVHLTRHQLVHPIDNSHV
jgi:Zinc finger, C2H2 type